MGFYVNAQKTVFVREIKTYAGRAKNSVRPKPCSPRVWISFLYIKAVA